MRSLLITVFFISTFLFICCNVQAQQQIENSISQYFRNRILWNAGFTGIDGSKVYAMQNRSWIGFDGAPVMTNITGEVNFGENSSAGLQITADLTGVLYRTYGVFNYAYRVSFEEAHELRIGVALALSNDRINNKYIEQGGVVDPILLNSINSKTQYDGSLGLVYINKRLNLGASFFRLRENFKSNNLFTGNLAIAQIGGTYDIYFNDYEEFNLRPLMLIKLFRKSSPILDLGAQFEYNNKFSTMLVYQSVGNIRAGAGIKISDFGEANFFYNTNIKIANASSQQYEIGLGINLNSRD